MDNLSKLTGCKKLHHFRSGGSKDEPALHCRTDYCACDACSEGDSNRCPLKQVVGEVQRTHMTTIAKSVRQTRSESDKLTDLATRMSKLPLQSLIPFRIPPATQNEGGERFWLGKLSKKPFLVTEDRLRQLKDDEHFDAGTIGVGFWVVKVKWLWFKNEDSHGNQSWAPSAPSSASSSETHSYMSLNTIVRDVWTQMKLMQYSPRHKLYSTSAANVRNMLSLGHT